MNKLFPSYSFCYVNIIPAPSLLVELALFAKNTVIMATTRKPAMLSTKQDTIGDWEMDDHY
jgi:hypothetical protein